MSIDGGKRLCPLLVERDCVHCWLKETVCIDVDSGYCVLWWWKESVSIDSGKRLCALMVEKDCGRDCQWIVERSFVY